MYPNGLDDPEGTGNIAFATNTGNGSGAKVPSASLGKYLYSRQFMEGCIKTVLGRFFLSMLGGGFKHVCMFNPNLGKSLMLTIVFFQMGWFNEPPSSRAQEVKSQKPKKALPTDCDVPWRWMKIRPLGSV